MEHLDALIEQYMGGMITYEDLEDLVFEEATIAAGELVSPNSPEFSSLLNRIDEEYATYVSEKVGY